MSNIIKEFESRIMLTNEEYLSIVSYYLKIYPNQKFLQNVNLYFDSDDFFLKKSHITLRVRTINDVKSELTMKIKGQNGDQEINDDLTPKEKDLLINEGIFPNGNVKESLLKLPYHLKDYKPIVSLYNRRLEIRFPDHLLVIDKNTYNEITDYNLEIETENSMALANQLLDEYIKKFHLSLLKQKYKGKATRALESAIKKIN
jgi:uncharacterized protein YjbK